MDISEFEAVVDDVVQGLPEWVHDALDNIDIFVADEPDEQTSAGRQDLLGLYIGTPLPERGVSYAGDLPDVIYVFRLAHLALNQSGEGLREEIARTVMHEIAHYFGIDDGRLEELGFD
jgi:predicted Zn-dependent protease with MMP-like domain